MFVEEGFVLNEQEHHVLVLDKVCVGVSVPIVLNFDSEKPLGGLMLSMSLMKVEEVSRARCQSHGAGSNARNRQGTHLLGISSELGYEPSDLPFSWAPCSSGRGRDAFDGLEGFATFVLRERSMRDCPRLCF